MTALDAKIVTEPGHSWWHCPNCEKRLAEIVGKRVVIRIGATIITLGIQHNPDMTCPRCGASSVLAEEKAA